MQEQKVSCLQVSSLTPKSSNEKALAAQHPPALETTKANVPSALSHPRPQILNVTHMHCADVDVV